MPRSLPTAGAALSAKLRLKIKKERSRGARYRFYDIAGCFLRPEQPAELTSRHLSIAIDSPDNPTFDKLETHLRKYDNPDGSDASMTCVFINAIEVTEKRFYQRNRQSGLIKTMKPPRRGRSIRPLGFLNVLH
jgi:hypothetical protein